MKTGSKSQIINMMLDFQLTPEHNPKKTIFMLAESREVKSTFNFISEIQKIQNNTKQLEKECLKLIQANDLVKIELEMERNRSQ